MGVTSFELSALGELCCKVVEERFRSHAPIIDRTNNPIVTFHAVHKEVGDIKIEDDAEELTIDIGDITHRHIGCYVDDLTEDQRRLAIVDNACSYIEGILAEEIEIFRTTWGGGTALRGQGSGQIYLWTGPIRDERK